MNLIIAETEPISIYVVRKNKRYLGLCPQYNLVVSDDSGYEVCEKMLFMLAVACSFKERVQTPPELMKKYTDRKYELLHLVQQEEEYKWRTLEENERVDFKRVHLNPKFLPKIKKIGT